MYLKKENTCVILFYCSEKQVPLLANARAFARYTTIALFLAYNHKRSNTNLQYEVLA